MKLNKILFSALMLSAINGAMTSCSDSFLEEDQITQYDTSYFNTQEGLDGLVTGAYEKLKFKFLCKISIKLINCDTLLLHCVTVTYCYAMVFL
jgi:hypothetical protein